ncbi:hypothetical protein [Actinokineospora diospyrosa]|uniref:Uncharacterized protein n=1 Tax=Actinokineospora diospyrosa TaxID=103728 RepID=A0ABT1ICB3_9PSEU|nr:hypothetical protein [Actinokineospora diospyrosa]MCP2270001.1 hypothetical protein [Actinokineospora diospyrosa]
MVNAFSSNNILLTIMDTLTGDKVDLAQAKKAFNATAGDFRARFTAAVAVLLAADAATEVFIEIPADPENMTEADLDNLVRPVAGRHLRSYPTKAELLSHLESVRLRQEQRPAWIPRTDVLGNPLSSPSVEPNRQLVITALPEVGPVTVELPTRQEERPELAPGGIGEWESALLTLLRVTGETSPAEVIEVDADAVSALVPEEARWWPSGEPKPLTAAEDPAVASELVATATSLGGIAVLDNTPDGYTALLDAVAAAGDWRYSPRWQLEIWLPGEDVTVLTTARAAAAGWADEQRGGLVIYVHGGALHPVEGLQGVPDPLHSYVLVVTRATGGADSVDTVHRITLSCPEDRCRRGGCPDAESPEIDAVLSLVVTAAAAAETAAAGEWAEVYDQLYGHTAEPEYLDRVLELATAVLMGAGWVALDESVWDGGLEEVLLRRGEHCLHVGYDPVTRQVSLMDGKHELEFTLQLLADDGLLSSENRVDLSAGAVDHWSADLLAAADDLLRGDLKDLTRLSPPVQLSLLGLHPLADGSLRGPLAETLVQNQLIALFAATGLLAGLESTVA